MKKTCAKLLWGVEEAPSADDAVQGATRGDEADAVQGATRGDEADAVQGATRGDEADADIGKNSDTSVDSESFARNLGNSALVTGAMLSVRDFSPNIENVAFLTRQLALLTHHLCKLQASIENIQSKMKHYYNRTIFGIFDMTQSNLESWRAFRQITYTNLPKSVDEHSSSLDKHLANILELIVSLDEEVISYLSEFDTSTKLGIQNNEHTMSSLYHMLSLVSCEITDFSDTVVPQCLESISSNVCAKSSEGSAQNVCAKSSEGSAQNVCAKSSEGSAQNVCAKSSEGSTQNVCAKSSEGSAQNVCAKSSEGSAQNVCAKSSEGSVQNVCAKSSEGSAQNSFGCEATTLMKIQEVNSLIKKFASLLEDASFRNGDYVKVLIENIKSAIKEAKFHTDVIEHMTERRSASVTYDRAWYLAKRREFYENIKLFPQYTAELTICSNPFADDILFDFAREIPTIPFILHRRILSLLDSNTCNVLEEYINHLEDFQTETDNLLKLLNAKSFRRKIQFYSKTNETDMSFAMFELLKKNKYKVLHKLTQCRTGRNRMFCRVCKVSFLLQDVALKLHIYSEAHLNNILAYNEKMQQGSWLNTINLLGSAPGFTSIAEDLMTNEKILYDLDCDYYFCGLCMVQLCNNYRKILAHTGTVKHRTNKLNQEEVLSKREKSLAAFEKFLKVNKICAMNTLIANCELCAEDIENDPNVIVEHVYLSNHLAVLDSYNVKLQRDIIRHCDPFGEGKCFEITIVDIEKNKLFINPLTNFVYCGFCRCTVSPSQDSIRKHLRGMEHLRRTRECRYIENQEHTANASSLTFKHITEEEVTVTGTDARQGAANNDVTRQSAKQQAGESMTLHALLSQAKLCRESCINVPSIPQAIEVNSSTGDSLFQDDKERSSINIEDSNCNTDQTSNSSGTGVIKNQTRNYAGSNEDKIISNISVKDQEICYFSSIKDQVKNAASSNDKNAINYNSIKDDEVSSIKDLEINTTDSTEDNEINYKRFAEDQKSITTSCIKDQEKNSAGFIKIMNVMACSIEELQVSSLNAIENLNPVHSKSSDASVKRSSSKVEGLARAGGRSTADLASINTSNKKGYLAYIQFLPNDRFACTLCHVEMSSWKNAVSHVIGSRHVDKLIAVNPKEKTNKNQQKMERKQSFASESCSTVSLSNLTQSAQNQGTYPHIVSSTNGKYSCNICNIPNLNSWHDVESHVNGTRHAESIKLSDKQKKTNMTSQTPQPSRQRKPTQHSMKETTVHREKREKKYNVSTDSYSNSSRSAPHQGRYPHIVASRNGKYSCKICNTLNISSWHDVESHVNGKKHAQSLELTGSGESAAKKENQSNSRIEMLPHIEELENGYFVCVLCDTGDITCWKNVLGHVNGLRHQQQLNQDSEESSSSSSTNYSARQTNSTCLCIEELSNGKYICTICETGEMTSWDDVQCHLQGNRHINQVDDDKNNPHIKTLENGKYCCVTCGTGAITSWDEVICHLNGNRHAKRNC